MNGDDETLIKEARRGSSLAFESLVRRYQGLVRGFLKRTCGDPALADDLAQETFVLAWRKIGSFDRRGAFGSWLCRIGYRRFLQHYRSAGASARRDTAMYEQSEQTGDARPALDARLDLDKVLAQLNPEQRAVMALCYGEGMSHQEASDALGLPLGTVKSHIQRGRAKV
ncbi:MAG: RNA polymerase sigma factor, partial [Caulobacterales bacterium]